MSLYENKEIRERSESLVSGHIFMNVSSLVCLEDGEKVQYALCLNEDEFQALFSVTNTTYKATDGSEFDERDDAETHSCELCLACNGQENESCTCDDVEEEEETLESLEFWVVSSFLAARLQAFGEACVDTSLGMIWGRSTSGQAIAMDGVLLNIAEVIEDQNKERAEYGDLC